MIYDYKGKPAVDANAPIIMGGRVAFKTVALRALGVKLTSRKAFYDMLANPKGKKK